MEKKATVQKLFESLLEDFFEDPYIHPYLTKFQNQNIKDWEKWMQIEFFLWVSDRKEAYGIRLWEREEMVGSKRVVS